MHFTQVKELNYITHIDTVESILEQGILSHHQAEKIPHTNIAMDAIQKRRSKKKIPGGDYLHKFANLYFDAHNPMLCKLSNLNSHICILRINKDVLKLPDVIITDRNASSDYVVFKSFPDGLEMLDENLIYAEFWTDDNQFEYWRKKSIKCAEILIPKVVPPDFISSAYVYDNEVKSKLIKLDFRKPIEVASNIFF